jgi:hypothetical protein
VITRPCVCVHSITGRDLKGTEQTGLVTRIKFGFAEEERRSPKLPMHKKRRVAQWRVDAMACSKLRTGEIAAYALHKDTLSTKRTVDVVYSP